MYLHPIPQAVTSSKPTVSSPCQELELPTVTHCQELYTSSVTQYQEFETLAITQCQVLKFILSPNVRSSKLLLSSTVRNSKLLLSPNDKSSDSQCDHTSGTLQSPLGTENYRHHPVSSTENCISARIQESKLSNSPKVKN